MSERPRFNSHCRHLLFCDLTLAFQWFLFAISLTTPFESCARSGLAFSVTLSVPVFEQLRLRLQALQPRRRPRPRRLLRHPLRRKPRARISHRQVRAPKTRTSPRFGALLRSDLKFAAQCLAMLVLASLGSVRCPPLALRRHREFLLFGSLLTSSSRITQIRSPGLLQCSASRARVLTLCSRVRSDLRCVARPRICCTSSASKTSARFAAFAVLLVFSTPIPQCAVARNGHQQPAVADCAAPFRVGQGARCLLAPPSCVFSCQSRLNPASLQSFPRLESVSPR
mgnify:CR=1 FL=1